MNQLKQTQKMGTKVKLSTLWIIVMFNMAFADILSFITPGVMKDIVEGTMEIQVN